MNIPKEMITKLTIVSFLSGIVLFSAFYIKGYDSSIDWNVTTTAESEVFFTQPFKKGPFEFSFSSKKYGLIETFSAGPVVRNYETDRALIMFILLGISLLIAAATRLPRTWFIGTMGLFIFFIINLHLPEVGIFGFGARSTIPIIILLLAYVLPAYLFHAFYSQVALGWRWLTIIGITASLILVSGVEAIQLQEQFIAGSYFGLIVLSLIFLLIIAEENVFGILFLITQTRGGKNNHLHFSFFSFVYFGVLIAYYGNKAAFWDIDISFFNPYVLLVLSSLVALWSLKYKQNLMSLNLKMKVLNYLFIGLGMVVLGFLALAMSRGNDPVYEGLHYFIVYTHVAFGIMFFLYLIWNFAGPLGDGLQVYKIAYREQNFPYISAKLAGLAAVAGMFFLSNKEPFLLFQAGNYNYLGAQAMSSGNNLLAQEYFREGSIFGYDNHFSNYQLGYSALQGGDIKEANYRFKKATQRYPSPQAFVNHAGTHAMMSETTPAIVTLKNGLRDFPNQNQLLNNLGLTFADLGQKSEALSYFGKADPSGQWTNAALVNYWKVNNTQENAPQDFQEGNLAVKTNILNNLILSAPSTQLPFDSTWLYPSYTLHRLAFLINGALYYDNPALPYHLNNSLSGQLDEGMYYDAKNAIILGNYKNGNINAALTLSDFLISEVSAQIQGKFYNQMGLLAFSQHAPVLAMGFFEQAIDHGSSDARINKAACLLELAQFENALKWSEYLITIDSSMSPLKYDILRISSEGEMTTDQLLFNIYYNYSVYSSAELNSALAKADQRFAQSLWAKIASEQMKDNKWDALKNYRAVFNAFLEKSAFEEPDLLLALSENEPITGSHPLAEALQLTDQIEQANSLVTIAGQNALNEPLVLAISDKLKSLDPSLNYSVLIDAININRTSVALHKAYVMAALDLGLEEYAKNVLDKITTLTTQKDYQQFQSVYLNKVAELDSSTDW